MTVSFSDLDHYLYILTFSRCIRKTKKSKSSRWKMYEPSFEKIVSDFIAIQSNSCTVSKTEFDQLNLTLGKIKTEGMIHISHLRFR